MNAEILQHEAEYGMIEAGKMADLVVVEEDPLEDIGNARKVALVLRGGRVVVDNGLLSR